MKGEDEEASLPYGELHDGAWSRWTIWTSVCLRDNPDGRRERECDGEYKGLYYCLSLILSCSLLLSSYLSIYLYI